ncbi:MFS transporter, OFA family, oxalate/formate antiporter [Ruminococcaceae bacterium YRB3002]|nr:MFS transporter, OFA family, oxalate/formate antiporter [Ruminococcaceae bacterium YRB3002]
MNKWTCSAIPALLIHCSIGTVYCWSTFKESIANTIGMSTFAVGWAFSFAIFFLGMSAAFAGKLVELNIHKSSLVSAICFTVGMLGTGLTIKFFTGPLALILIYLFYGCIMGIGLGVGYLTPVKTLMLWFKDNKGLATGISIMGFGLAKAIATPVMEFLQNKFGISAMFLILGGIYFVMMFLGHILLNKPAGWVEDKSVNDSFKVSSMFKNKTFIGIWLIFYINIHCGLMLITYEKQLLNEKFAGLAVLATIVSVVPSVTAVCNALGRIGYSTVSDKMKDRATVYGIIFLSCILVCGVSAFVSSGYVIIVLLMVINLGYGGGFSTLPALLESRFGMKNISKIHGLALSAWAVAGLSGNNTSELILKNSDNNYGYIIITAMVLYGIAWLIYFLMVKDKAQKK